MMTNTSKEDFADRLAMPDIDEPRSWHVCRVETGQEHPTVERLIRERSDLEGKFLIPGREMIERQPSRRTRSVDEAEGPVARPEVDRLRTRIRPLLPGYVFVRSDVSSDRLGLERTRTLGRCMNVLGFKAGERGETFVPHTLTDHDLGRILALANPDGVIGVSHYRLRPDQRINELAHLSRLFGIVSGPLLGRVNLVVDWSRAKRRKHRATIQLGGTRIDVALTTLSKVEVEYVRYRSAA